MRYRSRAHTKPDPLDGYNAAMRRALGFLAKSVCVASRGAYVPAGAPDVRLATATIAALNRRGDISWIAQNGRNDATLSAKGRAQAFIVTQRAQGASARKVQSGFRSGGCAEKTRL
jgi:hypothetical protein